jgi:hypothetical protein
MSTDLKRKANDVRELVVGPKGLKENYGLTWPKIQTLFAEAIQNLGLVKVKSLDHTQWRNIFVNAPGDKYYEWWIELELIINHVEKNLKRNTLIPIPSVRSFHEKINNKISFTKPKVRYGVFPCQDTILPLFFKQSYNRNLNVEFVIFENWNDGLSAFQSGRIDVALHNFPTTLAYNTKLKYNDPLFFYPFFSFNGYGIFIKRETVKKYTGNQEATFDSLSYEKKRLLVDKCKILVELNSDFEWAISNYCISIGCNVKDVAKNYCNCNTNKGKNLFLNQNDFDIYCTNPIHILDLQKPEYQNIIELIGHGSNIIDHDNFNGLICSSEYLLDNVEIVSELVATWFNDSMELQQDLVSLGSPKKLPALGSENNLLLKSLVGFLNEKTFSNISLDDLFPVFHGHNSFYDRPSEVFNLFYHKTLENKKTTKNYIDIALLQLGQKNSNPEQIQNELDRLKNHMRKI